MSVFDANGFALSVAFFACLASTNVVEDFVFIYLKQLGYDAFHIGLVPMLGLMAQLIGVSICSYLSDRYRLRKCMLFMAVLLLIPTILLHLIPQMTRLQCDTNASKNTSLNVQNKMLNYLEYQQPSTQGRVMIENNSLALQIANRTSFENISVNLKNYTFYGKEVHVTVDNFKNLRSKKIVSLWQENNETHKKMEISHKGILFMLFLVGIFQFLKRLVVVKLTVAAIDHLMEQKSKFAFYEGCGSFGSGIAVFSVAYLAGHFKHSVCGEQKPSYYFAFIVPAGLQCLAVLAVPWLKINYQEKIKSISYKEAIKPLLDHKCILLLTMSLHVGAATNFLFRWTYWFMEKRGGNTTAMGVEGLIRRPIIGTLWYIVAGYILDAVGEYVSVLIALMLLTIGFAFLALIENPWLVILADSFQYAAFAIFLSALVVNFSNVGPEELSTFYQGVASLTFNGVGKDIGSLMTGYFLNEYGIKKTLFGISVISLIFFTVFAIYASTSAYDYKRLKTQEGVDSDDETGKPD
ncbi:uncharacterized protein LOC124449528 [Xenia sp. Carnegie-2017]|uniref:uncharacterized protein LOC124449528 n=1 Tax=Xenia sp. Carnegie-2017 TaxID=2897299 RepID=UPI001F04F1C5|nr:uncharacterized protein LOC124449528 [Xenia sp. Carnegie-2017]